jgi:hypothetical protein
LLLKPEDFFRDLHAEPQSLEIPTLFVLTGGLIGAVSAYLIAGLTGTMMAGIMPGMEFITAAIAAVSAIVGVFIFWGIVAGVFFIISKIFKGTGSFGRSLEVVGYGYLPQVFGALITAIVAILYVPAIRVPSLSKSALENPESIQSAVTALMQDPAMMMIQQVTVIVSVVFLLWSAYIWIYGIKEARALSLRDAAITVGVPVLLYVIYLVVTIFMTPGRI